MDIGVSSVNSSNSQNYFEQFSERFIKLPEVMEKTGLSRSTIYRKMENEDFPLTLSLGPRSVAWLESEIDHWMRRLVEERNSRF